MMKLFSRNKGGFMAYVEWDNSYSVGVPFFDNQHQKLFDILNNFHAAIQSGKSKELLFPTLNELANYAAVHFGKEEEAMLKGKYANYAEHKKEHDVFTEEVVAYIDDFRNGIKVMPLDILRFVVEWLKKHIAVSDKAYGPALKETVN